MAQNEHREIKATSLGSNPTLAAAFGDAGLDEAAVSAIHRLALFRDNMELLGLQSGSVESVSKRGEALAKHTESVRQREAKKARSGADDIIFLELLDQINRNIAELDRKIRDLDDDIDHLQDYIARGEIELTDDGQLKDTKAEETLRAYEERTGQKIDRNNAQAVLEALRDENKEMIRKREEYRQEKDACEKERRDLEGRYESAATPEERSAVLDSFVQSRSDAEADYSATATDNLQLKDETRDKQGFGEAKREKLLANEELQSTTDFGFLDDRAAKHTASAADRVSPTPIKKDESIQMAFAKAHDPANAESDAAPDERTAKPQDDPEASMSFSLKS